MTKPLISVIVPIYAVEDYLRECVDSILAQTWENFELILVDDGSPDNCGAICDGYAARDDRVRVIHQENGGVSAARNAGLDIASGDYISFIDGDDTVAPRFLECLASADADIAQCGFAYDVGELADSAGFEYIDGREMALRMYGDGDVAYVVVWNKLWRRESLRELRFPIGKRYEDEFFTWRTFETAATAAVTGASLYYYRQQEGSFMHQEVSVRFMDAVEALQERAEHYRDTGDGELYVLTRAKLCHQLRGYMPDIRRTLPEDARRYRELLRRSYADVLLSSSCGLEKKLSLSLQMLSPGLYSRARDLLK